jgi:hypothetical protein
MVDEKVASTTISVKSRQRLITLCRRWSGAYIRLLTRETCCRAALLDAVCPEYFQQLDGNMRAAADGCSTAMEVLHALGMAYVRFALKTPVLYRIATIGEPRSPSAVDVVLASFAFVHLRAVVQQMIDDGIYPSRDANSMAFELWTAVHGIAALFIAKPYWALDDAAEVTYEVLRAMCYGQIAAGIIGHDRSAGDAIEILMRLQSSGRPSSSEWL